jgi:acyl-CoA thioesterase-1
MSPLVERERSGCSLAPCRALGGYGDARGLFNIARKLRALGALAVLLALLMPAGLGAAGRVPRVLAFGDSLSAGFGLPPAEAFPARLQARLGAIGVAAEVLNGGVSGDTSAGGLARLDWALADHPDLVLVELGANDALRGLDPDVTFGNLDKILARLKASGVRVILLGMRAPPNWGTHYQADFDAIYPKLAEKYGVPLYPFFLDGVAMDPSLNQADGLHPNARGVNVIVERVAPYIARALAAKGAQG